MTTENFKHQQMSNLRYTGSQTNNRIGTQPPECREKMKAIWIASLIYGLAVDVVVDVVLIVWTQFLVLEQD